MHIGIVAGSAEGAALCYRTVVHEGEQRLGLYAHPRVTMDSIPFTDYMVCVNRDDWAEWVNCCCGRRRRWRRRVRKC